MALTLHSTLHFTSAKTLDVVETIAQITAMASPASPAVWPAGVLVTVANGNQIWVALARVEWIEPK